MRSRTKERRKVRSNKKKIHKNGDGEKKRIRKHELEKYRKSVEMREKKKERKAKRDEQKK